MDNRTTTLHLARSQYHCVRLWISMLQFLIKAVSGRLFYQGVCTLIQLFDREITKQRELVAAVADYELFVFLREFC